MSLAVNVSNKPVILQQSQGHQTYNGNVDRKQDYNHAKFERSCFNGVHEKANVKGFSNEKISQLSPLNMCKNLKLVC